MGKSVSTRAVRGRIGEASRSQLTRRLLLRGAAAATAVPALTSLGGSGTRSAAAAPLARQADPGTLTIA